MEVSLIRNVRRVKNNDVHFEISNRCKLFDIAVVGADFADANSRGVESDSGLQLLDFAPSIGELSAVVEGDGGFVMSDRHRLPTGEPGSLEIGNGSGLTLTITLPGHYSPMTQADLVGANVVYPDVGGANSDLIVQGAESGAVRVMTIIPDSSSSHSFTYGVEAGFSISHLDDGAGLLVYKFADELNDSGLTNVDIFQVSAPWAVDSLGNPVETHFEIKNGLITQIVNPDADAVYPIIADPTWEWYLAAYGAGWNKAETRNLSTYYSVAALCGFLSPASLKAACAVGGMSWIINTNYAVQRGGCVFYAVAPVPVGLNYDQSKNCY